MNGRRIWRPSRLARGTMSPVAHVVHLKSVFPSRAWGHGLPFTSARRETCLFAPRVGSRGGMSADDVVSFSEKTFSPRARGHVLGVAVLLRDTLLSVPRAWVISGLRKPRPPFHFMRGAMSPYRGPRAASHRLPPRLRGHVPPSVRRLIRRAASCDGTRLGASGTGFPLLRPMGASVFLCPFGSRAFPPPGTLPSLRFGPAAAPAEARAKGF